MDKKQIYEMNREEKEFDLHVLHLTKFPIDISST